MRCPILALLVLLPLSAALADDTPGRSIEQLAATMPESEQDYRSANFDYALLNLKLGESYEWKSFSGAGQFTVEVPYRGKDTICRHYTEQLSVKSQYSMTFEGIACKRNGRDGWCRVAPNEVQNCSMESPDNLLDEKLRDARDAITNTQNKGRRVSNDWWPF